MRHTLGGSYPSAFVGRASADAGVHVVERADPPEGLGGQRRGVRGVDVKELAPHMRPAGRFVNARLLSAGQSVEFVESGIAVTASWAFSLSTRRSCAWSSASWSPARPPARR